MRVVFFALIVSTIAQGKVYAQNRTISGTVMAASDDQPIPGVNIMIKGTTLGTITDIDGKFNISAGPTDVLVFSFIGYLNEEVKVGDQTTINIRLVEDIEKLDEVVVIGYGVQKKKLSTGATVQIKGDELEKMNTTNALQALQGHTSGVNIVSTSGQPGEDLKVTIRGLGTIGNSGPLYIVDGVQTDDINYLNNADIESVDVLKDAASAAIYGSRAANGVILITTKGGKTGKSQITFDAYYGVQNRAKKIDMLDAKQYAMIMNEQFLNSGGDKNNLPFDLNNLPAYTQNGSANTNWLDEMFVNNAITQNYTLGATGGSEQTVYSMSLSYTGQEGIVGGRAESNYDRYTGRLNTESSLYEGKIKVGEHLSLANIKKNGISVGNQYGNSLRGAFNASPLIPMYDDNGNFFNTADTSYKDQNGKTYWNNLEANPYAEMVYNNQNETNTQKLIADVYTEIELLQNLKFRSSFGIDYFSEDYRKFTPIYQLSEYSFYPYTKAEQKMSKGAALNIDNILTYGLTRGSHKLDVMAGMSARSYKGSWMFGSNADLAFNDFGHAYLNNATNQDWAKLSIQGAPDDEDKLLSYFGRVQYNYNETYLLNATLRADGSSKFAAGNQWGVFPSVSAGWVMSNEAFLGNATFINFLKLRGSWGQNGNQNIDAFQYLAPIKFTQATYAFGDTEGTSTNGAYPNRLANDKLKWETSEQLDFGFDSRILQSKLAVTVDWYRKSTKDWLLVAPVLATAGTDAPYINGGKVTNTGVELGLSYNNNMGDFNYSIGANGSYNKNNVTDIPTDDHIIHGAKNSLYANSSEFYRAEAGHPIGYFWGYQTNGLFQKNSEVQNYKSSDGTIIQPNAKPGDVRYVDQNGDGKIDEKDKVEIGDPNPDFTFGINFSCNYKAFDFSVDANGVAGNQIVQSYRSQTDKYANYTTAILDRWTGEGSSNSIPRVTGTNINYQFSDLFIQNGSYLRLSNVTIGYDIAKVVKVKNFSECRVYASVQNLYTFTKYNGMDPEVGYGLDNGATDKFSSGIDLGFYPRPRTMLVGVSLKF